MGRVRREWRARPVCVLRCFSGVARGGSPSSSRRTGAAASCGAIEPQALYGEPHKEWMGRRPGERHGSMPSARFPVPRGDGAPSEPPVCRRL